MGIFVVSRECEAFFQRAPRAIPRLLPNKLCIFAPETKFFSVIGSSLSAIPKDWREIISFLLILSRMYVIHATTHSTILLWSDQILHHLDPTCNDRLED